MASAKYNETVTEPRAQLQRCSVEMQQAFRGKVVVLTGATSGIGRSMSLQLARSGAQLVLAARDVRRLQAVQQDCRAEGGFSVTQVTDVTSEESCKQLIERTVSDLGGIDVLINNAGQSMLARVDEMADLSLARHMMEVNYFGSVNCTFHALPHLKKSKGRLGIVASLTGRVPVPTRAAYAAAKIASARFHESLRIELADTGVSVTVVFPDFVATEIRARSLGGDNNPLGASPFSEGHMMTSEQCADKVLQAIAKRTRGPILSVRGNAAVIAKLLVPGVVELIARRAIRKGK